MPIDWEDLITDKITELTATVSGLNVQIANDRASEVLHQTAVEGLRSIISSGVVQVSQTVLQKSILQQVLVSGQAE